jgi:hypothetical protein
MPHAALRVLLSLVATGFVIASTPAFATAQRTFVASDGQPTNTAFNCSITKPCRAFSEAIGVTAAGGEVIVLDSAGYGAVSITQSVSIIAPPGIYAGISIFSGAGITVNGSGIVVVLRGLTLNGLGGASGISFNQGAELTVEDCEIANIIGGYGIVATASSGTISVRNTVVRKAEWGISINGALDAVLDGVRVDSTGNVGIEALGGSKVTVINSVVARTQLGVYGEAQSGEATDVVVSRSTITGGVGGLEVGAFGGGQTRLVADGNLINNVTNGAFVLDTGSTILYTSGTNTVGFNNNIVVGGALTPIGQH